MVLDSYGIANPSATTEQFPEYTAYNNATTNDKKEVLSAAIDRDVIEQGSKNVLDPSNIHLDVKRQQFGALHLAPPKNDSLNYNQNIGSVTRMPDDS